MSDPKMQPYFYHASALALGGQITRPFSDVLEAQAATSLPSVGGYASAHVENYRYRDLISFDRAHSVVKGSSRRGGYATVAEVTVEGLNIMDVVTADRVVGKLTSTYEGASSHRVVGSDFVNLRIAGVLLQPKLHKLICDEENLTLTNLAKAHAKAEEKNRFCDPDGKQFEFPTHGLPAETAPAADGTAPYRRFEDWHLVTSIFERLQVTNPAFTIEPGGVIHVPDFGRIILGRYLITRESRLLSMIVCHFGCDHEGTSIVVEPGGNGSPGRPIS